MAMPKGREKFSPQTAFYPIRVFGKKGALKRIPWFQYKCCCGCNRTLKILYGSEELEIGGVLGGIEDWRRQLVPLLFPAKARPPERKIGRWTDREINAMAKVARHEMIDIFGQSPSGIRLLNRVLSKPWRHLLNQPTTKGLPKDNGRRQPKLPAKRKTGFRTPRARRP